MGSGDNFANFVTLQLGTLLLSYSAVAVLLPQVGDPGDDSCQHVDKIMNRGLQSRRSILGIVCYSLSQSKRGNLVLCGGPRVVSMLINS